MFKRTILAAIILVATLCFMVKSDAAKNDNWLVYWYVCGTDIETTRIAFGNGTNLMSNDSKALILAEPDREPGDATRSIKEVEKATLSPNVRIFMQAVGTYIWGHEKFRDLNAKIQTNVTAYNRNADGTFSPVQGTVLSGRKVRIPQWFLNTVEKPEVNGKIGRYVYDKYHRNWHAREQLPISGAQDTETDMSSQAGLVSFLQAGQRLEQSLYPDGNVRRVFIFVDHG
ncbi:MAG: hypothetical protein IJK81_02585 [Selenomonadaceae bacterium]|nr:hypothetical protein [Selenomonadaceae bacterium]